MVNLMFSFLSKKKNKDETRASVSSGSLSVDNDFWYGVIAPEVFSGTTVTDTTAMQLWAVNSCITLISSAISQLPLKLKRKTKSGGTEDARTHPLFDLVKVQPNPDMISMNWREAGQGNLLSKGNQYSWIQRNGSRIVGLWPIEPKYIEARKASNEDKAKLGIVNGETIFYRVKMDNGSAWDIHPRDILHVVGFGWNGLTGESVITNFAKQSIGNGISLEQFQGSFFKKGIHASGSLEHPQALGKNKEQFMSALQNRYQGAQNTGVPMVLEDGMKWNQHKISLVDQQFLEQTKANALTICAMYHVPPSKIGIYTEGTSYNNTEQQNKNYLDDTLMQWIVRWEQSLDVKLLSRSERAQGYTFKHNFDALLRPDGEARAKIAQAEFGMGVPLNVIRKRNDEDPVEGGDISYVPANFIPAKIAGAQYGMDNSGESTRGIEQWKLLFRQAIEKIVRMESRAIQREAHKRLSKKDSSFNNWLDEYYDGLSTIIVDNLSPIIRGYYLEFEKNEQRELADYFAKSFAINIATEWIRSSKEQIGKVERRDGYQGVEHLTDTWLTSRISIITNEKIIALRDAINVFSASLEGEEK